MSQLQPTSQPTTRRIPVREFVAVCILFALVLLANWRLITTNRVNQASFIEGDFSGQFVAFAVYQAERLAQGEVPLWNLYNFGGGPFLADTQAAVFYPPRLITIALLRGDFSPGRMYEALQAEAVAHSLIAALGTYVFLRRLFRYSRHVQITALTGSIAFTFGGYLTGYPPLQLALLEAVVWLPYALLGILQWGRSSTTQKTVQFGWLAFSGTSLGLCLMAGHPQSALFFIYISTAYLFYRVFLTGSDSSIRAKVIRFFVGGAIYAAIGIGLACVQLLPAVEFLGQTTRAGIGVVAGGNGFPLIDLAQMLFPGILSFWSPLYFGVCGLFLAIIGLRSAHSDNQADDPLRRERYFWLIIGGVALALSVGANSVVYDLFYNVLPGLALFRGQERAAFAFAFSMAVLVACGTDDLLNSKLLSRLERGALITLTLVAVVLCGALIVNRLTADNVSGRNVSLVALSVLAAAGTTALTLFGRESRWFPAAIPAILALELLTFGRTSLNIEPIPARDRLPLPPMIAALQADVANDPNVYRVQNIGANYGTMWGIPDVNGISPLVLARVDTLLKQLPPPRLWEVFSVRHVLTPNDDLGVRSTILARDDNPYNPVKLHRITDPRPFVRLVDIQAVESDATALGYLRDPAYPTDRVVIVPESVPLDSQGQSAATDSVRIDQFTPESIALTVSASRARILSLSLVYYPGWIATINGQPTRLYRANYAFSALSIPPGEHRIVLRYEPASYRIGAGVSLITTSVLAGFTIVIIGRRLFRR